MMNYYLTRETGLKRWQLTKLLIGFGAICLQNYLRKIILKKTEYRKLAPNGESEIGNECHRSNSSLTEDENFQLV